MTTLKPSDDSETTIVFFFHATTAGGVAGRDISLEMLCIPRGFTCGCTKGLLEIGRASWDRV